MQVLLYKCPDYTITIKTSDIVAAWNRFNSRVPESSRTYCTYASTHEADDLQLLKVADDGKTTAMENIGGGKEWDGQPPVLFETEIYHFFIEFNCPLLDTPRINHPKREIAECFDYHKGMLTGSINFLNNPGTFILSFSYVKADGEHVTDSLTLEVVSPKLDTKRDLDNIKRLINAEYENYVYEYLTLTFQNHEVVRSDKAESKIIWLSIFKQVVEPYFKACRYIMQHTNRKAQKRFDYARPERVKRWSRQEEERYEERGEDAERFYYRHEVTEHTINTKENRFVKHTLIYLQKKFAAVFCELREAYEDDLSEQATEQMNEYESTFRMLLNSKFYRSVGKYEGHLQESAVLQQRSGYRNIYKYWQMLKCGLSLEQGNTNIGMKQIWRLYEIWCFLVMKRLVCKILNLDPTDPLVQERQLIVEDKPKMMESFEQKDVDYHVTFMHPSTGIKVELWYQHPYSLGSKSTEHSETTLQVPDIVLNVTKPNSETTLTYLFDAKYRVLDDKRSDSPTDEPVQDTINAMHRYRDAIYYGSRHDAEGGHHPQSKEVIGGYILFPGRVSDADKLENKYFSRSIQSVNIGAYPLLPTEYKEDVELKDLQLVECGKLEEDLRRIILEDSPSVQLRESIPQKGLMYSEEKDALVYIGFVKQDNPFFEDFLNNRAEMYYTGTEDTKPNLDIQSIKYFMPLIKGKIDGVYKVSAINAARKRDKEINEKTSNDGVRFFLMLDEFIPFGESIDHRNTLYNGDWMTIEEARDKYKELLHQLPQGHHHSRHGALPLETGV